jgi:hypothetical protein
MCALRLALGLVVVAAGCGPRASYRTRGPDTARARSEAAEERRVAVAVPTPEPAAPPPAALPFDFASPATTILRDAEDVLLAGHAGGPMDVRSALGASCTGFGDVAPAHVIEVRETMPALLLEVEGPGDTVLYFRAPEGALGCDDDGGGFPNPLLVVRNVPPGRYEIWMATFDPARTFDYTLRIAGRDAPEPIAGAIDSVPPNCGMTVPLYGVIDVGSVVRLGAHSAWTGPNGHGGYVRDDTWWNPEMWRFVGRRATVVQLGGLDPVGCPFVRVDVDGGAWGWRIRNLLPP